MHDYLKTNINRIKILLLLWFITLPACVQAEAKQKEMHIPCLTEYTKEEYNAKMIAGNSEMLTGDEEEKELEAEQMAGKTSYDPRFYGKVSKVKNQGNWGLCWVYSALATSESALIYQGFETQSVDLSELHAVYFDWKRRANCSFSTFCNLGGCESQIFEDMASGTGPVQEEEVPMQEITDDLCLDETYEKKHSYDLCHVYHHIMTTKEEDRAVIKQMITQYGGVCIGMYFQTDYFVPQYQEDEDATYYLPYDVKKTNHAVEIVGWDDHYRPSQFAKLPPKEGAWLVKNSFGTNGDNPGMGSGYIWVSYEDGSIDQVVTSALVFERKDTVIRQILLEQDAVTLPMGQTYQIQPQCLPASTEKENLQYHSSNPQIASVDETGMVTPHQNGNCKIEIEATKGFARQECLIQVVTRVERILLTKEKDTILMVRDEKRSLEVVCEPTSASDKRLFFLSSDERVVYVSEAGTLYAKGEGQAEITIRTRDGSNVSRTVQITVDEPVISDICLVEDQTAVELGPFNVYPVEYRLRFRMKVNHKDAIQRLACELSENTICQIGGTGSTLLSKDEGLYEYCILLYILRPGQTNLWLRSDDVLNRHTNVEIYVKEKTKEEVEEVKEDEQSGETDKSLGLQPSNLKKEEAPKEPTLQNITRRKIVKVTWKRKSLFLHLSKSGKKLDGYELQFAKSRAFEKKRRKTVRVKATSKKSLTVSNDLAKKYPYLRLRAYRLSRGKRLVSSWSNTVKAKKI